MKACATTRSFLSGKDSPFLKALDRAEQLFNELDASASEKLLLHGDIHHENILYDEQRGWLTIDPKGIIGDLGFNAARFLRNPKRLFTEHPEKIAPWLIEKVAGILKQPTKRLAGWAYVDTVLGECWSMETGESYRENTMMYLKTLESIMDTNS